MAAIRAEMPGVGCVCVDRFLSWCFVLLLEVLIENTMGRWEKLKKH
jgi:hypothetical protein